MSVRRTVEDGAADQEVWPRRFWDETPTLGWTPTLPDDETAELVRKARRAPPKPFGSVEPAPDAEPPPSV